MKAWTEKNPILAQGLPVWMGVMLLTGCGGGAGPLEGTTPPAEELSTAEAASAELLETGEGPATGGRSFRISQPLVVIDQSGEVLGSGEARLYAPSTMAYDENAEVRLEIEVYPPGVPPTEIPPDATPDPENPLALAEPLEIREFMGAALRGVDLNHFIYTTYPEGGVLSLVDRTGSPRLGIWRWFLTPNSEFSAGVNRLEVYVYLPNSLSNNSDFDEEVASLPFELEVLPAPIAPPTNTTTATATATATATPMPTSTPSLGEILQESAGRFLDVWAVRIVTLGTLIALAYGAYQYLRSRNEKVKPPAKTDGIPGKPKG